MIAVKEYNGTFSSPPFRRDPRLGLPGVTSAYRATGTRNFILIDRTRFCDSTDQC